LESAPSNLLTPDILNFPEQKTLLLKPIPHSEDALSYATFANGDVFKISGCSPSKSIWEKLVGFFTFESGGLGIEQPPLSGFPGSIDPLPADQIAVGYFHILKPYECIDYAAYYYRGAVLFDTSALSGKGVTSAKLSYTKKEYSVSGPDAATVKKQSCASTLDLLQAPTATTGGSYPYTSLSSIGYYGVPTVIDVTSAIPEILSGKAAGFLFRGPDETMKRENADCWARYGDFTLEVSYVD
jgi:hypothetical protein